MDLPSIFHFLAHLTHLTTSTSTWHLQTLDTMIVPDLTGLQNATAEFHDTVAENATELIANATEIVRKAKSFGKAGQLNVSNGTGQTPQKSAAGLQDRQTCASGSAFYACSNGFRGCCSVEACNPGEGCPDGKTSTSTAAASSASVKITSSATPASSTEKPSEVSSDASTVKTSATKPTSTQDSSSILTGSSTGSGSASSSLTTSTSGPKNTPAPACPAANNTVYTDSLKIAYKIRCNADNWYASSDTIEVSVGGYAECFSACSSSATCGGFTYVGLSQGSCYLKQQMPIENFAAKNGSNYVSCSKVNATASAPLTTPTSTPSKSGKTGAIAGGIVGGIAFLALLLLLLALLARRRGKKIEQRRATVTHVFGGPIETQDLNRNSPPTGHVRSGSTAHDAFAPFGGFYRGFSSAQADRQAEDDYEKVKEENTLVPDRPPPSLPPATRSEKGEFLLPATVYQQRGNPSADAVAMLDGTPIKRPKSQFSTSRSPRFHEHLAEMEDTSNRTPPRPMNGSGSPQSPDTDSPTLGRDSNVSARSNGPSLAEEVKRRQHLMSWNTYDPRQAGQQGGHEDEDPSATMVPRTPPSARSPDQVSPDMSNTPRDASFVVSPFGSVDRGYVAPR
ncbi:hypothetical protein LTR15_012003 [Elasticomyces elasticus]|nr:hypothetical protein LTR15_012003 [Elasticomyces elasticus]